jgi:hypothetical protein
LLVATAHLLQGNLVFGAILLAIGGVGGDQGWFPDGNIVEVPPPENRWNSTVLLVVCLFSLSIFYGGYLFV